MLEMQKTTISETESTQRESRITQREKREKRVTIDNKNRDYSIKKNNHKLVEANGFVAEETASAVYQNPFELSSLNGANGFQVSGISVYDESGYSVSDAGDVNKDGYDDLIIGTYSASPDGRKYAGQSYVVFGQANFSK